MDDSIEEWKPVVGYEGWYAVSSLGRIKRVRRSRGRPQPLILKMRHDRRGYIRVSLSKGTAESRRGFFVHTLVAAAFIGPRLTGMEINHKNFIKDDNRPSNLEYTTRWGNNHHASLYRESVLGLKNGRAKLTHEEVRVIRLLVASGLTQQAVADRYNVRQQTVSSIVRLKLWSYIA